MPIIKPLPIDTKGRSWWLKVWLVLTSARKYQLAADWVFVLPDNRIAVIPAGFIMDGASTPKFLWGILDPMGVLLLQGIVHDFGYRFDYLLIYDPATTTITRQNIGAGQKYWDCLFYSIGIHLTDLKFTGIMSYYMLRLFGGIAWRGNRKLNESNIDIL